MSNAKDSSVQVSFTVDIFRRCSCFSFFFLFHVKNCVKDNYCVCKEYFLVSRKKDEMAYCIIM